jgi:mRNA export factor
MDVQYPLMAVGTAERHIQIFNLTNPTAAYKVSFLYAGQSLQLVTNTYRLYLQTIVSPLKWQTRVVSCFTSSQNSGFAVGSIEGRVAIQ